MQVRDDRGKEKPRPSFDDRGHPCPYEQNGSDNFVVHQIDLGHDCRAESILTEPVVVILERTDDLVYATHCAFKLFWILHSVQSFAQSGSQYDVVFFAHNDDEGRLQTDTMPLYFFAMDAFTRKYDSVFLFIWVAGKRLVMGQKKPAPFRERV